MMGAYFLDERTGTWRWFPTYAAGVRHRARYLETEHIAWIW